MNARARRLREYLLSRPCSYCGERRRPGEPLIVHIPGCRYEMRIPGQRRGS